ncbi:MAG: ADP-ribose diphosphatase [Gammaproteobacteria bacterium CG11_big_fil_rev_8_21_14_0_20_46_22]|nr:MAG: ADP-ribose diphosphatase [Gammaproteobacteria bacterium CG12_big_fil_rev_8_21_14_0_65_46_12]PIR11488.1 MAG: ADP-ribose diphosphatase [Gammaproteobacteria bacterium CG11_big_fil_rev_8_21_14_0_20_46_22]
MKTKTQYTADQDVCIERVESLHKGFFHFKAYYLRFHLFEGGMSEMVRRELLEQGESVGVLPYDPARQTILLLEQFRVGALGDRRSPWLYELVAGRNDQPETLESLACRESQEEAGLDVMRLEKMCEYWSSPGVTDERFHLYLGYADLSNAQGVHGLKEEHEDIRVHEVSIAEIPRLLQQGDVRNAMTVIALQWFLLHKVRV